MAALGIALGDAGAPIVGVESSLLVELFLQATLIMTRVRKMKLTLIGVLPFAEALFIRQ
jgi:hypothetical protein